MLIISIAQLSGTSAAPRPSVRCEIFATTVTIETRKWNFPLLQGYTVSINSKHFMVEGTATYTKPEARAACQAKGGDLAIFKTAEEFLAVKPIMPRR